MSSTHAFGGSPPWYLVQCKTGKEYSTALFLKEQMSLPVYLPESWSAAAGQRHRSPLFPGYFFLQVNLDRVARSTLDTSPGVLRLVGFDGAPQPVPWTVLQTIAEQIEARKACPAPTSPGLSPGDRVRMKEGSLQELDMVFLQSIPGGQRVSLLLKLMGRLNTVVVERDALEKVSQESESQPRNSPPSTRFTRGKGRIIRSAGPLLTEKPVLHR